ncbi:RNA polymerase sigma factor [Dysosmobacter sp.]
MQTETPEQRLLKTLYLEQYHSLFLYANAVLRDSGLAEEAVQDTFRIACGKISQLSASENPAGWLVQTLKNVLRNMERSRSSLYSFMRCAVLYNDEALGEGREETNVDLLYGDLLPQEDFRLLKLVVLERYSYLEAAQELGISLEACRKRVQRIKQRLRQKLKE